MPADRGVLHGVRIRNSPPACRTCTHPRRPPCALLRTSGHNTGTSLRKGRAVCGCGRPLVPAFWPARAHTRACACVFAARGAQARVAAHVPCACPVRMSRAACPVRTPRLTGRGVPQAATRTQIHEKAPPLPLHRSGSARRPCRSNDREPNAAFCVRVTAATARTTRCGGWCSRTLACSVYTDKPRPRTTSVSVLTL